MVILASCVVTHPPCTVFLCFNCICVANRNCWRVNAASRVLSRVLNLCQKMNAFIQIAQKQIHILISSVFWPCSSVWVMALWQNKVRAPFFLCVWVCVYTVFWHQLWMHKLYPHPGAWYVNFALMLIAYCIDLNECLWNKTRIWICLSYIFECVCAF